MKEYKLNKEFAEKWVMVLRSGKYQQGHSLLYNKDNDSYCCLGVAANICGINSNSLNSKYFIQESDFSKSTINKYRRMGYPKELSILDEHINGLPEVLAELNDGGTTFEMIADWIEKNVEFVD